MSLKRVFFVARRDLAEVPTRPLYLLWALFLGWNGFLMSRGSWFYRSVDTSVGTQVSWFNSEFQIAFVMGLIGFLIVGFFVALAVGMPLVRDASLRVGEILHATPLRVSEYVWGKFLAAMIAVMGVLSVLVLSNIFFSHVMPNPTSPEAYAPFQLRNYVMPAVVFLLPAVVLLGGAAMALGAYFNRAQVVFLLPTTAFVFYQQTYWGWFPEGMDPAWSRFFQWMDPSGFRWLKQNWLVVDRGIAFYNETPINYDAGFLIARLGFVIVGLSLVAWTSRHLRRTLRGQARLRGKAVSGLAVGEVGAATPLSVPGSRVSSPLSALAMRVSVPGPFRGTWSVARFELRELFSHAGLYILLPIIFMTTFIVLQFAGSGQGGVFSPGRLVTSGAAAAMTLSSLNFWMALLILFFVVEALAREEATRVASIYLSTPVRTASILLGKMVAVGVVMLAIMLATFLAILIQQAGEPKVSLELKPFLLVWGLIFGPTFLLWTAFVTAAYAVTRSRYGTYGAGLVAIGLTGWWATTGDMTWLTNWPVVTLLSWSDISVFELDRTALTLNRLLVLSLALAFGVLAWVAYGRREKDLLRKWTSWVGRRQVAVAALLCAMPLFLAFQLYKEVHSSFQGDRALEQRKEYWRQNLATWGPGTVDVTLPELAHVEIDFDLDPARRAFQVDGHYDLVNQTGEPLPWLPVTGGLYWRELEWTLDGRLVEPELRSGLFLFHFETPIEPGASLRLGFRYQAELNRGSTRNGIPGGTFEFMLDSGVVVTGRNPDFVPVVGYVPGLGIDEDNQYESKIYPSNYHEGVTLGEADRSWFTHRLRITAPSDYTVNSTGALTSQESRGERTTWTWETDYPVRVFNIIAGRWEVKRGDHGTAVFYDEAHPHNVDLMLEALDGTRRFFSQWYHPYPWKELRLSEFPGIVTYARGNATNIFFSEATGFLTAPDPRVDTAFSIAAHEAAHSWWGHIVGNGAGPGGIVISEGGAHFATMMLLEELRGPLQRMSFSRNLENMYGENRQPSTEEPLAETDYDRPFADAIVIYNKGSWVLWMLMREMGREAFLEGIQDFFRTYHRNPDHPVIQDLVRVMRPHAPDPPRFDAFAEQWFFGLGVPEYRLAVAKKEARAEACADCSWTVTAEVFNAGTGRAPVEVAATRGRRFDWDGSKTPGYRDCRGRVEPVAGGSEKIELVCDFEPDRLTVDPDLNVLQLQRSAATVRLR